MIKRSLICTRTVSRKLSPLSFFLNKLSQQVPRLMRLSREPFRIWRQNSQGVRIQISLHGCGCPGDPILWRGASFSSPTLRSSAWWRPLLGILCTFFFMTGVIKQLDERLQTFLYCNCGICFSTSILTNQWLLCLHYSLSAETNRKRLS
jgi:hypothetical protein